MAETRNDYDSPWKEILEAYFRECMAFFFEDVHSDIDWEKGYAFLDKELQQIVREAEVGKRIADKLVKVWKKTGEQVWVLVHIEVQSQPKSDFAERMYTYNYRLRDRFKRPVASFALLSDDDPQWRPAQFRTNLWDCTLDFRFRSAKLLDYAQDWDDLLASNNPFAVVVMSHLKTLETAHDNLNRKQWKLTLIKLLFQRGYDRQDVIQLFRFIDWILVLPEALENSLWQDVLNYQEELKVPYMMSFERSALKRGREEGREEGLIEGLCSAIKMGLKLNFGEQGLALAEKLTENRSLESLRQLEADLFAQVPLSELKAKYESSAETKVSPSKTLEPSELEINE
ncbi:MAG: cytosolic protein [Cyanobacteria bacterium J06643_4]